jgi:hypothetical protein
MPRETVSVLLAVPNSFRVTVFPSGEAPLESKWGFSVRVEDEGVDITHNVTALTIHGDMRRQYAEIEVTGREGFDGPFCTPAMPL